MSVSNLTNTKWLIRDIPTISDTASYSINFKSNGFTYTSFGYSRTSRLGTSSYYLKYSNKIVWSRVNVSFWSNNEYKTIIIIGGTDVTNANLVTWLSANAHQDTTYPPTGDITFWYKDICCGATSTSGTKTIDTEGTWLEDDISVVYTKTAGSAATPATTITANPTISVDNSGVITASVSTFESVTPTVTEGYISSGTAGTITVNGSSVLQDSNLVSGNIKKDVTIFNVTGTYDAGGSPVLQEKTATPSSSQQEITADTGYDGLSKVTVSGDANLVASNIKKDVSIFNITGSYEGGSSNPTAKRSDVNFFDYDGTIVVSYSAADFANLSAMPDNPSHQGLTAQGWNWTLADAKAQVLVSGALDIGQMYTTSDGKTKLYITLSDGRLSPCLCWSQTVSNGVTIDWGDGSATETQSGTGTLNEYHQYAAAGDYVVTLNVTSGSMLIGGTNTIKGVFAGSITNYYRSILRKVELGANANVNAYGFYSMFNLQSVTVPSTATTFGSFYTCSSLRYITIPPEASVTSFRASASLFAISFPKTVTIDTNTFYGCQALHRAIIPQTTTVLSSMFQGASGITKLTIPSTVTSIGNNAFSGCTGMAEYHIKPTTPPTLGTSVFNNIPSDCKIYVPSASLATYQGATGWSGYASYMVGE